jgi:hypothetical protein
MKTCCGTQEGQYRNILFRNCDDWGTCRICKQRVIVNPSKYGSRKSLDWIPDTYIIEELLP